MRAPAGVCVSVGGGSAFEVALCPLISATTRRIHGDLEALGGPVQRLAHTTQTVGGLAVVSMQVVASPRNAVASRCREPSIGAYGFGVSAPLVSGCRRLSDDPDLEAAATSPKPNLETAAQPAAAANMTYRGRRPKPRSGMRFARWRWHSGLFGRRLAPSRRCTPCCCSY